MAKLHKILGKERISSILHSFTISLSFLSSGVFVNLYFNQRVESKIDIEISNWHTRRVWSSDLLGSVLL